ncbi:MFS transporter [Paraferrimonas sedimenticola]|uniref:MFS transporter n=1 Tax=Paraferrimonas sedimenticola TaxID=375674 RepID=A0AA37RUR7_9GAMM|nr:MFS transporter [Paraferrimonas sedimenticola]GLP95646.1 MFS transporter [Paraferrimonas sedimenticola]
MKQQKQLLLLMIFVMSLVFSVWQVLLNNFVIERASFTGEEIGLLQSLREVPGFLAFTAVFVLLVLKEQSFAFLALGLTCIGVAVTGFFPSVIGLYLTTVLMSIGFHYFETVNQSLTLQWVDKKQTATFLGEALAWKAAAALSAYASIWLLMSWLEVDYQVTYALIGGLGLVMTIALWVYFPRFKQCTAQEQKLILRKDYWLYYALLFFSGARRQIFMVFAGFMMVEKFGYSVSQVTALFLINYVFNLLFAKRIGKFISRIGEHRALTIEYVGLMLVFISYALVEVAWMAAALYVIDHLLFAMAIAIKTYFQKIARPADIAATAGISFTINHIAAVVIPALLGLVWVINPSAVFYFGALLAACSLILAQFIPTNPERGNETRLVSAKVQVSES